MNYLFSFIFLTSILFACNQSENTAKEKPTAVAEEVMALNLKLDATEAQLYNLRIELSKCKGDSVPEIKKIN